MVMEGMTMGSLIRHRICHGVGSVDLGRLDQIVRAPLCRPAM